MKPNPKKAGIKTPRNWRCPRYEECLNIAYKKYWNGWSCDECSYINEKAKIECDLIRRDYSPYAIRIPKNSEGKE